MFMRGIFLLEKINFLRRFISNISGKTKVLSPLPCLKKEEGFIWEPKHQQSFDEIKRYLSKPTTLLHPMRNKSMKLYIVASESTVGSMLSQEDDDGIERAIYYLS